MLMLSISGNRGHLNYVSDDLPFLPEVRIGGICSGPGEGELAGLQALCARAGFSPKVYPSWTTMLDGERPDLAVVCGPFQEHASMCAEGFMRSIPVFCEKPVALDLDQLDGLRAAWSASGVGFLPCWVCATILPSSRRGPWWRPVKSETPG